MKRAAALFSLLVVGPGCGAPAGEPQGDPATARVSATTTQVADLVRNVARGRAEVDGLLPANADPHDYEPRPSDVGALEKAAVVFRSGGEVDVWADQLIDAAGGGAVVVDLLDAVSADQNPDPHWWQDPRAAIDAVGAIRDALAAADPKGEARYSSNAQAYVARLEAIDEEIATCVDQLAPDQRKLVTEHDALGPFADRYGLEVIGATTPALTTQAQPSAGETAALVDQIRASEVLAIFPERGLNPDLAAAIADEAGARVGGALYADSLGAPGSGGETYAESMRANAATIVSGLSGGELGCEGQ